MSSPYESADLLLKLYELRREPTMREARAWFAADFNPTTFEDVKQALAGPKSGQFRMVSSYWDMAASFVNNGAINEQMFADANGEQYVVFAKIEPFLVPYREMLNNPNVFVQIEKLIMKTPGVTERLAALRERFRGMAAARAQAAKA